MKTFRLLLTFLLLPFMMAAQVMEPANGGSTNDSLLPSVQTADGMVLVVPYPELVMQRLDALVDDSLMETSQLGLLVWDLTDDMQLYARNPRHLLRTASTMKLLTAITALDRLGKDYQYNTSLYYSGDIVQGQLRGDIICRGGMDPMFDRKDMEAFVQALKNKGVTSLRGRIVTDNTMKVPDKWGEGWCWDDDNPTLVPLLIEGKPNFSEQLLKELQHARINTTGVRVSAGTLPNDAKHLCTRSHAIGEVLKQMMKESDNLYAECTYYQVAASSGKRPAKAKDAQTIEKDLLNKIGLDADRYSLADGSGLSLYNYLSAEAQVALLRYAWQSPNNFQTLFPALPIAGEDGTLKRRMQDTPAQGKVWAKTGTVAGVSALSGYLVAPNGHYIAFSIINQGVKQGSEGRRFQDRVCNALCQP